MTIHEELCGSIDRFKNRAIGLGRQIHAHPELKFEERFAAGLLAGALGEIGVEVERGVAGLETAFRAAAGKSGPTVAILAEYDALALTGGAEAARDLPIPGRDLSGIHYAMDFLPQQNRRVSSEPLGSALSSPCNDHAAIAVSHQDYLMEVLVLEHAHYVLDVSIQIDRGVAQVGPLTEPGERGRENTVSCCLQQRCDPTPAPSPDPPTMHQQERAHVLFPRRLGRMAP